MLDHYILDKNNKPVPVDTSTTEGLMKWAKHLESNNRRVAQTDIGKVSVSTIFLGLDHGFNGGKPLLFETMVFGGKFDQNQERYCTYEEALEGHNVMVQLVEVLR